MEHSSLESIWKTLLNADNITMDFMELKDPSKQKSYSMVARPDSEDDDGSDGGSEDDSDESFGEKLEQQANATAAEASQRKKANGPAARRARAAEAATNQTDGGAEMEVDPPVDVKTTPKRTHEEIETPTKKPLGGKPPKGGGTTESAEEEDKSEAV